MAAGRSDVTRRRDVEYSKKGSRGVDWSIRRKDGYGSYSDAMGTDGGRNGEERAKGFVVSNPSAGISGISKVENGVSKPTGKKRKFSPVVWDRDGKDVRISSKNRLVQRITPLHSPPSLSESFGKSPDVATDRKSPSVATDGDVTMQILPVRSLVAAESRGNCEFEPLHDAPSLGSPEQQRKHSQEVGQFEEEDVEYRHISTSRWAYLEYSPGGVHSDKTQDIPIMRRVEQCVESSNSPESGEFRREGSKGSQGNSSASNQSENQVDNDYMEIDEKVDEGSSVSFVGCEIQEEDDSPRLQKSASPKPRGTDMLLGCQNVSKYETLRKINEGAYGVVYKARDLETGEIVALKKVKMGVERNRDGFPMSALREINLLLSLHHPSVVVVKEVVVSDEDDVFMVMEYMEHDLKGLVETMKEPFSEKEVKCLMRQLLEGVEYLHDNWILHRDLKTSNLLLNNSGKLKICDFGLSRQYGSPLKPYTPLVVTLWYRAPELLLGAKQYSTAIDMWSVGCIMAELLAKQPLFSGKTEIEQLDKIFRILGTPNEKMWTGFSNLPGAKFKFAKHSRNTLRDKFPPMSFKGSPVLSEQGVDLLSQLLTYDPEKRISAQDALKHSWFHVESEEQEVSVKESLARRLKLHMARHHEKVLTGASAGYFSTNLELRG
ncbi:hypothetical protein RHSIM_Rhsim08G0186500 [Rhododendron simsii]|uniref:cyclin-dependent kinase n=1 Tax=Rhododendron simsii TaxID=118357 RepID=A0A834GPZ3_RHOSS|nr:hypothetical protein RHSIM_Rhsim08G0186500 [Rhododendron simsii]